MSISEIMRETFESLDELQGKIKELNQIMKLNLDIIQNALINLNNILDNLEKTWPK